jgi:virginiamycin B lyase
MPFGRVRKSSAALAMVGFAALCLAPVAAPAQEPMALDKFSAAGQGPLGIAAGSDGNLYVSVAGSTAVAGITTGSPEFAQVTPGGRVTFFGATQVTGLQPTALTAASDGNVWFIDIGNKAIGRILVGGLIIDEVIKFPSLTLSNITSGPNNNIWFTESTGTMVGTVTTAGASTLFTEGIDPTAGIQRITGGPDGNVWFTEAGLNRVASITPQGRIMEFGSGISPSAGLFDIKTGPDGNLWFTESTTGFIGRITPSGVITEFRNTGLNPANGPFVLTSGPDGNLWFGEQTIATDSGSGAAQGHNRIGKITTNGIVTEFLADVPGLAFPDGVAAITTGPNNTVWFVQTVTSLIAELTLDPPSALTASLLPGGRTVAPGAPATVFASMINGGAVTLDNCQVSLPDNAPLGLTISYQQTNPATNVPVGPNNTPFSLAPGGVETLLLTFQSATPLFAPGLKLNFNCSGTSTPAMEGLTTVDLYFSADAVPDDIVIAASTTPGIVEAPINGSSAFGVAMINDGGSSLNGTPTQVSVDTGLAILPVTAAICQTNPATGACLQTPEQTQFVTLPAGSTATFSVFVNATAGVPLNPIDSRVYVRFIEFDETQGILVSRGSANIAVQTTN